MRKSNSHFGVACGIFIMIFVSGYFSMINQKETSFKNTEYMQKRKLYSNRIKAYKFIPYKLYVVMFKIFNRKYGIFKIILKPKSLK